MDVVAIQNGLAAKELLVGPEQTVIDVAAKANEDSDQNKMRLRQPFGQNIRGVCV